MYQDLEAIADPFGNRLFDFQRYQVTISEIEALTGWTLSDDKREVLELEAIAQSRLILRSGEAIRVQPIEPLMLSNGGGTITLMKRDEEGQSQRMDRVRYTKQQASIENVPLIFSIQSQMTDVTH